MKKGIRIIPLILALILLTSLASATVLRVSAPDEVGALIKFNISVKSTVSNLAGFQITLRADNAEFLEVHKGEPIEDWSLGYVEVDDGIQLIGVYSQRTVSGTALELAKITVRAYKNTTFWIDREETKLVNPDEREIKVDRFYNRSVRVHEYGDVNLDGLIDVEDIMRLKKIILLEEEETLTSDMNDDGEVNILDLIRLINLISR
ncbi:MAG: hypothetical protein PWR13_820 [Archaeoglobi archaeon]|nr:hypothetical protein [Archaeoglobi archaeon]